MLKMIGIILVIFSSTTIGFSFASRLERRKCTLEGFKNSLSMLEAEISFSQNSLSRAFYNISRSISPKIVSQFYENIYITIDTEKKPLAVSWSEWLDRFSTKMCISRADMQVLINFSNRLGKTDIENELKNIHNTASLIDMQLDDAKKACDTSKKMYQSAGILAGILVVVLLF